MYVQYNLFFFTWQCQYKNQSNWNNYHTNVSEVCVGNILYINVEGLKINSFQRSYHTKTYYDFTTQCFDAC